MAITQELLTLSKTYPTISVILAVLLFFIGLRVSGKLLKWFIWILAGIAIIIAIIMFLS